MKPGHISNMIHADGPPELPHESFPLPVRIYLIFQAVGLLVTLWIYWEFRECWLDEVKKIWRKK